MQQIELREEKDHLGAAVKVIGVYDKANARRETVYDRASLIALVGATLGNQWADAAGWP